jgi:hypothetical protein
MILLGATAAAAVATAADSGVHSMWIAQFTALGTHIIVCAD